MIFNYTGITTFVQDNALIGIPIDRMAIIDAGTEQRSISNISSYDITTGRINFDSNLSGNLLIIIVSPLI